MADFPSRLPDLPGRYKALSVDYIFDNLSTSPKEYYKTPLGRIFFVQQEKCYEARHPCFRMIASGEVGYDVTRGAFESELALAEFIPSSLRLPVGHGTYHRRCRLYHYVCEYIDTYYRFPSAAVWAKAAAGLHVRSMKRPAKEFGFHCTNYVINVPIAHQWKPTWEAAWAAQMKSLLEQDAFLHGIDEEYSKLQAHFFKVVIPTYLRPLESGGRSITPCLIHSNLGIGNAVTMTHSEHICMLNSSAYWGHHEAELGVCRIPFLAVGEEYIREYLKLVPASEPKGEFDIRNAIYAMKHRVLLSLIHRKCPCFRQTAIDEMRKLVALVVSL
ncbi:Fructosamine kinase-domain-containing protein [Nemania sp. NC0429]|nr:Fructosamine kinase-domain-containing protein [Nemania sp. NC0429]